MISKNFKIFYLVFLISLYSCLDVDRKENLIEGLLEGSGIKLNVKSALCENEFDYFSSVSSKLFDSIMNKDQKKLMDNLSDTMSSFSKLLEKNCINQNMKELSENLKRQLQDPYKLLLNVLNKLLSMHTIPDWLELVQKLKEGKLYDLGRDIGELLGYIARLDVGVSNQVVLKRFMEDRKVLHPKCVSSIKNLILEMMKILGDMYLKESTDIDIQSLYMNLTNIFQSCL